MQNRIDEVGKKGDVVEVTKGLYQVARDTVEAEKEAFELKQRTELAAEVKSVLDSWVRFEAQQREAEQALVTESVIRKVAESLRDDKMQKQILESAVADIESRLRVQRLTLQSWSRTRRSNAGRSIHHSPWMATKTRPCARAACAAQSPRRTARASRQRPQPWARAAWGAPPPSPRRAAPDAAAARLASGAGLGGSRRVEARRRPWAV